jgi:hypothetical protein
VIIISYVLLSCRGLTLNRIVLYIAWPMQVVCLSVRFLITYKSLASCHLERRNRRDHFEKKTSDRPRSEVEGRNGTILEKLMYSRHCLGKQTELPWKLPMMNRSGQPFTKFPEIVQNFKMPNSSAQPPRWPLT